MPDDERNCGKAFGFRSTKEVIGGTVYYFFSYICTIMIPNIIAAAIGVRTVDSFCNDHRDTCDQYHLQDSDMSNSNVSLEETINNAYSFTALLSLLDVAFVAIILLGTVTLPKLIIRTKCQGNESESVPLLSHDSSSNSACALFKKFKDNVLPNKMDVYQLFMTAVCLMAGCAYLAWLVAEAIREAICNPEYSVNTCDYYFPNATTQQLHEAIDLSNDAYNATLSSGILLGAVASILIPVVTMSFAVYCKYRMSQDIDTSHIEDQKNVNNFYSVND